MQLSSWLEETRKSLESISHGPGLDGQILLMHELGKTKSWILAHPEYELESNNIASLHSKVNRARQGEPIPYIIGHWEFYALDFLITPDVLIPRPETEMIVDMAVDWIKKQEGSKRVLDMGTGSGCIAVAIALHAPKLLIVGVDSSEKALGVAQKNAEKFHVENQIRFLQSNLFSNINDRFDVICANLPYIPNFELSALPVSKYEPNAALDGGEDGLAVISLFLGDAGLFISHPGLILCEHGIGQEDKVRKMAAIHFPYSKCETHKDLHGISRTISIQV